VTVPARTLGVLDGTIPVAPSAFASETVPAPIIPGLNADPSLRRFGNTYYLYPTTDLPKWSSSSFSVWTSPDLKTWSPAGVALDLPASLSWARTQAWTPDCVERDGNYYFYFCAETKIGVAKASRPEGPFRDALGGPLLQQGGAVRAKTIAPHVFIDDDGQAYLYYGSNQNFAQVVRLGADMISVQGAPEDIAISDFLEGLIVFKRRGVYYFMWTSQPRGQPTRICYGTSDSPLGPIRRSAGADVVLRSDAPLVGAGYHSVLNIPGTDRWYAAYHRHAIPGGGLDRREICLARLEFASDGSILPIDPLAPVFGPDSVGETLNGGVGRR
jgi:beta-xylosidase